MTAFPGELEHAVARVATVPHLLVVSDFDGVLAPIAAEPALAATAPQALTAIESLVGLPHTTVAVVSGRALDDLAALARLPRAVRLVGSHGMEYDGDFGDTLSPQQLSLRERLREALESIIGDSPGVLIEHKPASIAVHYRNARPEVARQVVDAVQAGPMTWPDIHVTTGKQVIELSVMVTDKGVAVDALRASVSADAVVFLGDDVTDEDAFARLRDGDVGIKVGPGPTRASFWVPDPPAAIQTLVNLAEIRAGWCLRVR